MTLTVTPSTTQYSGTYLGAVISGNFRKHERLRGRTRIQALLKGGRGMSETPIRLIAMTMILPTPAPVQAAFAVPKRHLRRAVQRNRVRRLMREAFRGEKQRLGDKLSAKGEQCALLFIYQGSEVLSWPEVQRRITRLVDRLLEAHGR